MKNKLLISILFSFVLGITIIPSFTLAQNQTATNSGQYTHPGDYQPLAPITDPFGKKVNTSSFSSYLQSMYTIGIGATFVIGVIIFIIAGFQKIGSESVFGKSDANKKMTNALIGLVIALVSYILLQTINSDLLKFNISIPQPGSSTTNTNTLQSTTNTNNASGTTTGSGIHPTTNPSL